MIGGRKVKCGRRTEGKCNSAKKTCKWSKKIANA